MATIKIDDFEYDLESLSEKAKAQLGSLSAVDRRIAMLQEEMAILQTARIAYGNALKDLLPTPIATAEKIEWPN